MYAIAATCDASHVGHIRNCIKDTHITDLGLSLLSRLASVFANITAAVGTIAVVVVTTAAVAVASRCCCWGSEIGGIETFFHGYNLCVLYSC